MKKLALLFICLLSFAVSAYSQLPDITGIEYFFDTDPGPGNGIAVSISTDSIISESFNADVSGLDVGRHLLYVRTLDENGKWSLAHIFNISKSAPPPSQPDPLPEIILAEYFFDTDPGPGNGIAVSISTDSIISESFNADVSGLDVGRHLLYVRTLDENGKWSLSHPFEINKAAPSPSPAGPLPDIILAEYFFDTDPGPGNGIAVSISTDSIISESFNADVSGLDVGRHLLYVRTLDENGKWSLSHPFEINKAAPSPSPAGPLPDIILAEYFFDTDPGPGNGIAVSISTDSIINESFNAEITDLHWGRHLLYVRTLDENGKWSLSHPFEINKAAISSSAGPLPDIVAMEYFVDTDPGYGNGIDIPVLDPDSLVDVNFDLDVSSWGTEVHILYVRALDELGRWSLVYLEPVTKGDISRRMRHGKFFFNGIEQPMFTEDIPD